MTDLLLSSKFYLRPLVKLSVVIVNYNVQHFLEQCLQSVYTAIQLLEAEVWVVDNCSVDGSVDMVKERFPWVNLLESKINLGFSKGNNLAIQHARGEYVLLLNPDTVVEKDTFLKCVAFMDQHPESGGLGVYMVDGKGNFLPESKRSLPTPEVAFYKIFGLSALFPQSKIFGKYHCGYLDKDQIQSIEILSGAFMWLRKSALDKVGLLDEDFFMYGEDIDLSYRLILAGFKNYYLPETKIIHYKGESTKKGSVNYVIVFYKAMIQFAQKHFTGQNAALLTLLINIAIYLRAGVAIAYRFASFIYQPVIDFFLLYGGGYLITTYWATEIRTGIQYPHEFFVFALPSYIAFWLGSVYLSGGYDKPVNLTKIVRGLLIGTGCILVMYALLDETYRFSRAIILFTTLWSIVSLLLSRALFHSFRLKDYEIASSIKKRIVIAGSPEEAGRVEQLLSKSSFQTDIVGRISPDIIQKETQKSYLGTVNQLEQIIDIYGIKEVIFCGKDFPAGQIISCMSELSARDLEFKIAPEETDFIIGSNSIDTAGDLYMVDINSVNKPENRRKKRIVDLLACLILLPFLPLLGFTARNFFTNWFTVFLGKKTWVGVHVKGQNKHGKMAVLHPADGLTDPIEDETTRQRLGLLYNRDYKAWNDIQTIVKGFRKLLQ